MKKTIITIFMVVILLFTCSCGGNRGQKLYTQEEFLDALEKTYTADFKIVKSNAISNSETLYTVIIEGKPDIEFEVKNYLKTSSEVGPAVNRIECEALMYYFISEYAYEGYMLYSSGNLDSDYYVLPMLKGSDSHDSKYSVSVTSKDKEVLITVLSGGDEVFAFSAGKESDFRGICWDKNSYDLWLQYKDGNMICYKMTDEKWEEANGAEKPDYIIYNIHPTWK